MNFFSFLQSVFSFQKKIFFVIQFVRKKFINELKSLSSQQWHRSRTAAMHEQKTQRELYRIRIEMAPDRFPSTGSVDEKEERHAFYGHSVFDLL